MRETITIPEKDSKILKDKKYKDPSEARNTIPSEERTINKKRSQIHQNQDEKEQVGVESGNAVLTMLPKQ